MCMEFNLTKIPRPTQPKNANGQCVCDDCQAGGLVSRWVCGENEVVDKFRSNSYKSKNIHLQQLVYGYYTFVFFINVQAISYLLSNKSNLIKLISILYVLFASFYYILFNVFFHLASKNWFTKRSLAQF